MKNTIDKTYQDDADYYEAANLVVEADITAFVESFEDEVFWEAMFAKFAPSLKIHFESHSRDSQLKSGKQEVLKEKDKVGKNLILCIDSDFDYLLQNPKINDNPYIFQTYTYSIENHKCAPQNLNRIVKIASLKQGDFDLVKFLEKYSQTIYPIFLYLLYFEQQKYHKIHNQTWISDEEFFLDEKKMKAVIGIPSHEVVIENEAETILESLKKRVVHLENEIKEKYGKIELNAIDNLLKKTFKINQSEIFWYINGHILYDNIVLLLLSKLISSYKREQRQKYETIPKTETVKSKHQAYKNYTKDIKWETLLATNHLQCLAFEESCPLMVKIGEDIRVFCQKRT